MCAPPLLACFFCQYTKLLFSPEEPGKTLLQKPEGSKFLPALTAKAIGTIYFLHGFGSHAFAHKHPIQDFRKAGYNVVAFHLLGHGSAIGKLTRIILNYRELVDHALSVFQYYNERCGKGLPVAFMGLSTGAVVLLLTAGKLREDIETKPFVRCIIGVGTAFHVTHNAKPHMRMLAPIISVLLRIPLLGKWLAKHTLPRHFSVHEITDDKIVQQYLLYNRKVCKDTLPIGWASSIDTMGKLAFSKLGEVDIPVLLLHGNQDTIAQCPTLEPGKHRNTTLIIRCGKHDIISGPDPRIVPIELLSHIPDYKPSMSDHESRRMVVDFLDKHMK